MALKATRITGPLSPPILMSVDGLGSPFVPMSRDSGQAGTLRLRRRIIAAVGTTTIHGWDRVQLLGLGEAHFLRASSRSFASVQTS
jgi:hypothetical protein